MEDLTGKLYHSGTTIHRIIKDEGARVTAVTYELDLPRHEVKVSKAVTHEPWWRKQILDRAVEIDEDVMQGFIVGIFERIG